MYVVRVSQSSSWLFEAVVRLASVSSGTLAVSVSNRKIKSKRVSHSSSFLHPLNLFSPKLK